ncbi:Uncharacterised protein [Pseudomonas fluorescens]|uniref:YCII-related domain-containing protein n=1 Tax=Pseudomonas fluorescens TaxID=294 RepID=A0A379IHY1_PSEFL|nr:YciI family protein [Pseudomonas fluorescens]AIG02008.1 hypothetical protein HZ99_07460 [Pseudomonas fluorescens]SUD31873.1 Uncharacterised protein [Pseudomonas fluorescens]
MFFIILRFTGDEVRAAEFMDGHMAYIKKGFDDGVFLVGGPILPAQGGGIIAHGISRSELEALVSSDPFVIEHVVEPEILEVNPLHMDKRLESILR